MTTIDMEGTAANIGKLMKAAGFSVADVAEVMGFSSGNAVYKWLHGASLPSLDNLVILSEMLGTRMDEIIVVTKASA